MNNLQSLKLIDANKLLDDLSRVAFDEDSEDQKWDSGCWLRYRLVRKIINSQPEVTLEDQMNNLQSLKLIDANKLLDDLSRAAFDEDSEDQKWDDGCWLRYRLVKKIIDSQPEVTLEDQLNMIETIGGPADGFND